MKRLVVLALLALSSMAHAQNVTVGLFAPTAPFPSTPARVDLASKLGDHIGKALGGSGSGKVFARGADFAAAVKKGEVTIALVDAAYLAVAGGNYTVVAAAVRGGESTHGWQLVARGTDARLASLKGKRVLVPGIGGRESDFVQNVMFGGEIAKDFFGKVEAAPDTVSALAALGLGKADAAIVPTGVTLPQGAAVVLQLPALSGPVLVVYGGAAANKQAIADAALSFKGDATVASMKAADAEAVRSVARRFVVPVKRGPLAVPAIRLLVGDLVEGRTFAIERTPITAFAAKPR